MSAHTIALPDELDEFVSQAVLSGQFAGPNELVTHALYAFRDQAELEGIKLARLRRDLAVGLEQLDAGDAEEWNLEAFLTRMRSTAA